MNKINFKERKNLSWLIASVIALLVVINFFLPFASAKSDCRENLREFGDHVMIEELDMTYEQAADLLLFDYIRIKEVAIIMFRYYCRYGIIYAFKKRCGINYFSVLTFLAFLIIRFDFSDSGIVPGYNYNLGISYYLYFALPIILAGASVWMIIEKSKAKKQNIQTVNI